MSLSVEYCAPNCLNVDLKNLDVTELLLAYLEQLGVEYVFGIPGGAIEPLYNALAHASRKGGPRPVVARHETGAVLMAQAYALETGKLGVCCVTTGPGATNALTGIASAYQEEVPMLFITAQTALKSFGRANFQDSSCTGIDVLGIFQHCTRYSSLVSAVDQFEFKLVAAVSMAYGPVSGPVHLTIPVDVMRSPVNSCVPAYQLSTQMRCRRFRPDMHVMSELYENVAQARNLVVLIGEGCNGAAMRKILQFSENNNVLLVTAPGAKGLLDPFHPLYRGVFGFAGHDCARQVLLEADCILAAGMRFGEWETGAWDVEALMNQRLVHIDGVAEHLLRTPMARLHVQGDIEFVFQELLDRIDDLAPQDDGVTSVLHFWAGSSKKNNLRPLFMRDMQGYDDEARGVSPAMLMDTLSRCCPAGTRFYADVGNSLAWAVHFLHVSQNHDDVDIPWFRTSTHFGAMGWAIAYAVGAAIANRNGTVVCITGDGSVLMNGQELTVAVAEGLNVIFIVLNDQAYGMVKHGQRLSGAEAVAFDIPAVDFCAMAQAMGVESYRIKSLMEFKSLDFDLLGQANGPVLLDVSIDPEAVPNIGMRITSLQNG